MTIDEEIEWWKRQSETAASKNAALVAWGVHAGLRLAKADHLPKEKNDAVGANDAH